MSRATPPPPDPCLVKLYTPIGTRLPKEKDWIEARKCPRGCGEFCRQRLECYEADTALDREEW